MRAGIDETAFNPERVNALRDADRVLEIQSVLEVIANNMAMPLYLLFWLSDLIYVPQLKWEFLAVRTAIIPHCLIIRYFSKRAKTFFHAQLVALAFNLGMSSAINYMIFRIHAPATPYYAGLNLVALGNLAFIPWSRRFYLIVASGIFVPFYTIAMLQAKTPDDYWGVILNSFFIFSTILMLFYTRFFNEKLRQKELVSRVALNNEVLNRDHIIQEKSVEAIKLASLSRQFSPQVVAAIRSNKINLAGGIHRSNICAIFIDIVNSTERVSRVDMEKVHKVISMFMEDTMRSLLKYDITIDKFLGDGILAFSNDPVQYGDFVDRVVKCALEIREKITQKAEEYENLWMNKLSIRIGIAKGWANVGFYGNDRYFKSYTAIGPVVNLASRLCSIAEPDQIVATAEVLESIDAQEYSFQSLGKKTLKGFEADVIKVFEIQSSRTASITSDKIECPACPSGTLFLDNDEKGIFVFKCRDCGHVQREVVSGAAKKAA